MTFSCIFSSFTIAGAGLDLSSPQLECQTSSTATKGSYTAYATGKAKSDPYVAEEQILFLKNASGLGDQIVGTDATDGMGNDNSTNGTVDSTEPYAKFRWQLKDPYTFKGTIPTMFVEFDVSAGLGFYGNEDPGIAQLLLFRQKSRSLQITSNNLLIFH